jgi:hypothetical protein
MSVELDVQLTVDLSLKDFLDRARSVLQLLLNVASVEELSVVELEDGKQRPARWGLIEPRPMYLIGTGPLEYAPSLLVVDTPAVGKYVEGSGRWACVSVVIREPVGVVLVAALAITLGQMTSSPVVDDSAVWFPLREQAAEECLSAIASSDPQPDFETAVLNVYARLEVAKAQNSLEGEESR